METSSERSYFVVLGILALIVLAAGLAWARPWEAAPLGAPAMQEAASQIETATAPPSATPAATETPATAATPEATEAEPSPTAAVERVAPATPAAPPPVSAGSFAGRWRIVDTVEQGASAGATYTFDVVLVQSGARLEGSGDGIVLAGTVNGDTATVEFRQPALGYSGTFTWTLEGADRATGTFRTDVPTRARAAWCACRL